MVNTRNFVELDDSTARKVQIASAACYLSSREFVQIAVESALAAAASKNIKLAMVMAHVDKPALQPT